MKTKRAVIFAAGLALSATAIANEHSRRGELYGGPVVMKVDLEGAKEAAKAIGGSVGVNLKTLPMGTISLDTFFSRTIDAALGENNVKADANNAAFYVAYRSPGKVFGIAKAGLLMSNISSDDKKISGTETGFAGTLGAGFEVLNGIDLEASYTHSPDKLDVTTLSIIFSQ